MHTVFVLKEHKQREAGSAKQTVVLCVEIEDSGKLGIGAGFMVEKVDVKIGREVVKVTLIGWVEFGCSKETVPFEDQTSGTVSCILWRRWTCFHSQGQLAWVGLFNLTSNAHCNIFGKPYIPPCPSWIHVPYYNLPTLSPHDGTVKFLTLQHTKPKPWMSWTPQTMPEGTPASFQNLHPSSFLYSQPTLPPPPPCITPALALQHTQLDQHLKPLASGLP
ncbi:uncharacterized protein LACBIDRAFT_325492 [Laccaria bicolor S238N-H82]|uniref:Predicted protein n=1 Tax=Laccaria bicolor (strain S238N-H82 / ATCC MYA-4686) TaxID=486041 RepID=B0D543_LACBS|nr:uncharacterized protein LACBIDRAFT_325492 [Laccaria bicolor S238N-H82]EDR10456.1 predicted protein [Laccaria bicolor S238N-H82]|eukprot:XP_001878906.1 predicted protein [Laccaria bicolor S238N-H82]